VVNGACADRVARWSSLLFCMLSSLELSPFRSLPV
jgi:hypothetical protein